MKVLSHELIAQYRQKLLLEDKSRFTIEKYLRDINAFESYLAGRELTKESLVEYKHYLDESGYKKSSINSILISLNLFLKFIGLHDYTVKGYKIQKKVYMEESRQLTGADYYKLLEACGTDQKLNLMLQTFAGTGIRVSELKYFTVEAVLQGEIIVSCKNKTRSIMLTGKLKKKLLAFAKAHKISSGIIFCTKNGTALDRSNIVHMMKALCEKAGVCASKVFPHNFRKLFARTFYNLEKDISKLADILGHSSINTTRIYIMTTGNEHRRLIERMGLVV